MPMRRFSYASLDSTNLEARRLWQRRAGPRGADKQAEPLAVTAEVQTAGMGRAGRTWQSPRGGLWLSVMWPLAEALERYVAAPLVAGLATAEAIAAVTGLECRIKWPNDILADGRKLAGILCQGEPELDPPAVIVGIGINANYPAESLGPGLRHEPTSLLDVTGRCTDVQHLADVLVAILADRLARYDTAGLGPVLPELRRRLAWLGEMVVCQDTSGGVVAAGRMKGIDESGQVLIESCQGIVALAIGELRLSAGTGSGT